MNSIFNFPILVRINNDILSAPGVAEYNGNNAWLYNADNGCLNNNNKYNSNQVRPFLDFNLDNISDLQYYFIPLETWLEIYYICRRRKSSKPSHLIFYFELAENLAELTYEIGTCTYKPRVSIAFIITLPKPREVIAADFADRIIQTWFVINIMPLLETKYFDEDSYSCRVGKGGLKAVLQFQDYICEATNKYTLQNVYIASVDLSGFFTSIDTILVVDQLIDFINENVVDSQVRYMLVYLCDVIFRSKPQLNCVRKSPMEFWDLIKESKRIIGKDTTIGIPIGNITSQLLALFVTTLYLRKLRELGYKFVHYTDDTFIVVTDKKKWLRDIKYLEKYLWEVSHLVMHPNKRYLQHYSKGVNILGFRIKYDKILPSDRTTHKFKRLIDISIRRSEIDPDYISKYKTHLMQSLNSYLGLFKWCNTFNLRKEYISKLLDSNWKKVYTVSEDYLVISIKPEFDDLSILQNINKHRKQELFKLIEI